MDAADIRTAYSVPTTIKGANQVVALLELDGYNLSDITGFCKNNSIPTPTLVNVLVNGATTAAGANSIETVLDIDVVLSFAPSATVQVYIGPDTTDASFIAVLNEMLKPTKGEALAMVISCSWGSSEDQLTTAYLQQEGAILAAMRAQGQSFFAASGDSGSKDDGSKTSVDDPASNNNTIGCGGTTLTVVSSTNATYVSEAAWSGSGGGSSTYWGIPSWQSGIYNSSAKASTTKRNVPDVAMNADPNSGYIIMWNSTWYIVGGTSAAAPAWAGLLALTNSNRKTPLTNVVQNLYTYGKTTNTYFHDIKSGSNGGFSAVAGPDLVTGLGSFNATTLITKLSSL